MFELHSSLINQLFITVGGFNGKGQQTTFFYKVNPAAGSFLQFTHHVGYGEQRNACLLVILHKYVHIAVLSFLAAGKRTKESCLQDGLRLEVIGYCLFH